MHHIRKILVRAILLAGILAVGPGRAATITISCGAVGAELELCREGAEAWAKQSGHQVQVVSTPNSSSERLALYQQLLAAQASDIDVFQIDVIWPGMLANHLHDLRPYLEPITPELERLRVSVEPQTARLRSTEDHFPRRP